MGKFVVIVLDGFGVGAMPDVPQVRPADCGANTCVHIFERTPDLKLPNLSGNLVHSLLCVPSTPVG